ncbi:MAG: hypothetical protein HY707_03210, partial [Ignavibacteriae bacterium]|nr:hypothetical protein [Ignavibacteriota bacterium]
MSEFKIIGYPVKFRIFLWISSVLTSVEILFGQNEPKLSDYYPLKVGSSYTYYMKSAEVTINMTVEKFENGVFVKREKDYYMGNFVGEGPSTDLKIEKDRILEISEKTTTLLKSPLKKGTKWKWQDDITAVIEGVGVRHETPAGIFRDCIKVKLDSPKWNPSYGGSGPTYVYFARGVGLIEFFGVKL